MTNQFFQSASCKVKYLFLLSIILITGCSNESSSQKPSDEAASLNQFNNQNVEYDRICNWLTNARLKDGQVLAKSTAQKWEGQYECNATVALKGDCSVGQFALVFSRKQHNNRPRTFYSNGSRSVELNFSRTKKPFLNSDSKLSSESYTTPDLIRYLRTVKTEKGQIKYSNFEFVDSGSLILTIKLDGAVGSRDTSKKVFYDNSPQDNKEEKSSTTYSFDSVLTFSVQSGDVNTQVVGYQGGPYGDMPPVLKMNNFECQTSHE